MRKKRGREVIYLLPRVCKEATLVSLPLHGGARRVRVHPVSGEHTAQGTQHTRQISLYTIQFRRPSHKFGYQFGQMIAPVTIDMTRF